MSESFNIQGVISLTVKEEAGREHVVCAKGPGLFALSAGLTAVSAVLQMNHFDVTKQAHNLKVLTTLPVGLCNATKLPPYK